MTTFNEQIKKIHDDIAESQWEIMWGKTIEQTIKEILERKFQNN